MHQQGRPPHPPPSASHLLGLPPPPRRSGAGAGPAGSLRLTLRRNQLCRIRQPQSLHRRDAVFDSAVTAASRWHDVPCAAAADCCASGTTCTCHKCCLWWGRHPRPTSTQRTTLVPHQQHNACPPTCCARPNRARQVSQKIRVSGSSGSTISGGATVRLMPAPGGMAERAACERQYGHRNPRWLHGGSGQGVGWSDIGLPCTLG